MNKTDLNGERSQCRYTGLSYCSVTHREACIPACRTEMVNMEDIQLSNIVSHYLILTQHVLESGSSINRICHGRDICKLCTSTKLSLM